MSKSISKIVRLVNIFHTFYVIIRGMKVKVYNKNVSDISLPDVYPLLSAERQADIDRKAFEKDRRLSAGAGLLMARAFKDAGIAEARPAIVKGPYGKPCLRDYKEIFFNLSHSGEYVFLAVSDAEVGCDVEEITQASGLDSRMSVAKRFFTKNEAEAIENQPDPSSGNELFYKIWTMKESFIKAKGGGLSIPLDSFDVLTGEGTEGAVFETYDIAPGYVFTSCILQNGQE